MALNKLKKWIGTQAMTAFFDQLNDNVDATNAAIDLVESHLADYTNFKGLQMLSTNYTGDYNDLPHGSVVRTLSGSPINSPFPECFTWTLRSGTHGVQLSLRYTQNRIAYRRLAAGTWNDWAEVSMGG